MHEQVIVLIGLRNSAVVGRGDAGYLLYKGGGSLGLTVSTNVFEANI